MKSVQSTLSYLITTTVPRVMFTHFLVEHELSHFSVVFILNGFTWGRGEGGGGENYII